MLRDPLRDPLALSILSSEKIRRIQNFSGLRAPKKAPESKTLWSTSMNEQVKKLYDQAWAETTDHYGTMQKFAELIITECIDCLNTRAQQIGDVTTTVGTVGKIIKEHFGVKD